jgi:hypothetical protein
MAGGYNADVRETVKIHLQTVTEARRHSEAWRRSAGTASLRIPG